MTDLLGPNSRETRVILASSSQARADMLRGAGVPFEIDIPGIDERAVRESLAAEGARAEEVTVSLAELKALAVSRRHPAALIVGADQMLDCNGVWFEKPEDAAHARASLIALSGRKHRLTSGVVVALEGARIWHAVDSAAMRMREMSEDFIDRYLENAGGMACNAVGAYQLEGLGAQLFAAVEGDYFTVLGLPLLPLLDFLRARGVLAR